MRLSQKLCTKDIRVLELPEVINQSTTCSTFMVYHINLNIR